MKIIKSIQQAMAAHDADIDCIVEDTKQEFALALEKQRRRHGASYKQLAQALQTSAAYISKVFRGDSNLTIESMVKLAHSAGSKVQIRLVDVQAAAPLRVEVASTVSNWALRIAAQRTQSASSIKVTGSVTAANGDSRASDSDAAARLWARAA